MMNKRLFKKQMKTILITVIAMIVILLIANYLKTYGLSKLFTIGAYKEAFTITSFDKYVINLYATAGEILALIGCYMLLSYNKDIAEIEREERIFMKGVNMEWRKA